jgi:hypothetical protein
VPHVGLIASGCDLLSQFYTNFSDCIKVLTALSVECLEMPICGMPRNAHLKRKLRTYLTDKTTRCVHYSDQWDEMFRTIQTQQQRSAGRNAHDLDLRNIRKFISYNKGARLVIRRYYAPQCNVTTPTSGPYPCTINNDLS